MRLGLPGGTTPFGDRFTRRILRRRAGSGKRGGEIVVRDIGFRIEFHCAAELLDGRVRSRLREQVITEIVV